jgi:hypothetical protein
VSQTSFQTSDISSEHVICRRIILDNLVGHVVDNQRATADINQRSHQNLELSALFMFSLPVRPPFSSLISILEK